MRKESKYYLANHTAYVIRGNPKERCFYSLSDYDFYIKELKKNLLLFDVSLHAYVLTRMQIHLLMTPHTESSIPLLLKKLEHDYQQRMISRCYTTKAVWSEKCHTSLVQPQAFLLSCSQYIESLPVALGLCNTPREHPWSSFKHNALGLKDPVVTEHESYLKLGKDGCQRSKRYYDIFGLYKDNRYRLIRSSLKENQPLGNKQFISHVQQCLTINNQRVFPGRIFFRGLRTRPNPWNL